MFLKRRKGKSRPDFSRYSERDATLKRLGFSSYVEYLRSPLWASIRKQVLYRAGYACFSCPSPATQVHHRRYDHKTLAGKRIHEDSLVAICRACHEHIETDDQGRKFPIHNANKRLKKLRNKYQHNKRRKVVA